MRLHHVLGSTTALSLAVTSIAGVVAPANAASLLRNGDTVQLSGTIVLDQRGIPVGFNGNAVLFCPKTPGIPGPALPSNCPAAPNQGGPSYANAASPVTGSVVVQANGNTGYFSDYNSADLVIPQYAGTLRSFDATTFTPPAPGNELGDIANFLLLPQITEGSTTTFATQVSLIGESLDFVAEQVGIFTSFTVSARGIATVFDDVNLNRILDPGETILESARANYAITTQFPTSGFGDGLRTAPTAFSATMTVAVPEPSGVVGLLALAGLGTTRLLKKKSQKI
jgi:hypothetical protein